MRYGRLLWAGLVSVGVVGALAASEACGGGGRSAQGAIVFRGEYDATGPGKLLAITFLDATTYTLKRAAACTPGNAICVEHGTYVVDQARGTLTLTAASSGATETLPFTVLSAVPVTQAAAQAVTPASDERLGIRGGVSLGGGGDASLTDSADAALTGDGGSLTQDGGDLVSALMQALTMALGGQGMQSGSGADNGDAGGNDDSGAPLGFDGGADLDSGDQGTSEPDALAPTPSGSDAGGGSGGDSGAGGSDAGASSSDAGVCGTGNVNQQSSNATWSAYNPANAVAYADAQWSNGVGLCAQFTSASVTAGGVAMSYTWVPDIVTALSGVAYDEYSPSQTSIQAAAGDIVVYSNATGGDFCQTHQANSRNCGHVGLVVTAGNASTATADFHNSAHHHLALKYILEGTTVSPASSKYSTFRVYHVAALAGGC
jgi:hypothetical protein